MPTKYFRFPRLLSVSHPCFRLLVRSVLYNGKVSRFSDGRGGVWPQPDDTPLAAHDTPLLRARPPRRPPPPPVYFPHFSRRSFRLSMRPLPLLAWVFGGSARILVDIVTATQHGRVPRSMSSRRNSAYTTRARVRSCAPSHADAGAFERNIHIPKHSHPPPLYTAYVLSRHSSCTAVRLLKRAAGRLCGGGGQVETGLNSHGIATTHGAAPPSCLLQSRLYSRCHVLARRSGEWLREGVSA